MSNTNQAETLGKIRKQIKKIPGAKKVYKSIKFGQRIIIDRINQLVSSIQIVYSFRKTQSVFPAVNLVVLYRIYKKISAIEKEMIGRYPGSITNKLAHTLPIYLVSLQNPQDSRVAHIEIGTLFGGSIISKLVVLTMAQSNHRVIAIDPLESYYGKTIDPFSGLPVNEETVWSNIEKLRLARDRVKLVKCLSTDPAAKMDISDCNLLTLFIDGDHSYEGVKADWDNFSPLVEPGGYVIFDDYGNQYWPEVKKFVDELIESLPLTWKVIGVLDTTIIIQKQNVG